MGVDISKDIKEEDYDYYNKLNYEYVPIRIVRTIDSERFVGFMKDGWNVKKILCKSYGYNLNSSADNDYCFSKFNSFINEGNNMFGAKIHGVDDHGYVLVTLIYKNGYSTVKDKMLKLDNIDAKDHIDHFGKVI